MAAAAKATAATTAMISAVRRRNETELTGDAGHGRHGAAGEILAVSLRVPWNQTKIENGLLPLFVV